MSASGGTIIALAGNYNLSGDYNLDFGGKNLTIRSDTGPSTTRIDCGGVDGRRAFYFHSARGQVH